MLHLGYTLMCKVCRETQKVMVAFSCGHMSCSECFTKLKECRWCRKVNLNKIVLRLESLEVVPIVDGNSFQFVFVSTCIRMILFLLDFQFKFVCHLFVVCVKFVVSFKMIF